MPVCAPALPIADALDQAQVLTIQRSAGAAARDRCSRQAPGRPGQGATVVQP